MKLTYISMDPVGKGVGASQVLPYVEQLGLRGVEVRLHSFEPRAPGDDVAARLRRAGVEWRPHHFGRLGAAGGVARVLRAAVGARHGDIVHARSDMAAAAAMLGRAERLVWDVRSLWVDQRIELGVIRPGSAVEGVLRRVERAAAERADGIVTLTEAVVPELERRHGPGVAERCVVIPTCVDTRAFTCSPLPSAEELVLSFVGSMNRYYDGAAIGRLVTRWRARRRVRFELLAPGPTAWEHVLAQVPHQRGRAAPHEVPAALRRAHVGLVVCREDVGPSRLAAMPTKLAEYLASGRPVVVSEGLGDASTLVTEAGCGVVLSGRDHGAIEACIEQVEHLLSDPELPDRCRAVALRHFDLFDGVARLIALYERVVPST